MIIRSGVGTGRLVTVRPGTTRIDVPLTVRGDTSFDGGQILVVTAQAVKGTVIGNYIGHSS